jgi:hypothetical protein
MILVPSSASAWIFLAAAMMPSMVPPESGSITG